MSERLCASDNAILSFIFNPNLPLEDVAATCGVELKDEEILSKNEEITKKIELEAIQLAEQGDLSKAFDIISRAIEIAPKKPSLYSNRAHILQYMGKCEAAMEDVNIAIKHCTDKHRKTRSLAHCQRGILYKKLGENELAKTDFEVAAELGNKFAKKQLVELNPYAALCNQMLRQVMDKLQ
ncbi:tetratricopeptide repeat protein 36 homolog [Diorhabda sublineata]|uniref:tetratricopeptide repeat protein 36 homolog n=1 Tax=Diorhabda sublineata TaxID=1163346 RepID=UPI0024E0A80A|nr:tetratricopeptide repeat protein 36 homolog [Diorhabda sublineata]